MDYERGLEQLKQLAEGTNWYADVLSYEARLHDNLDFEQRYGRDAQNGTSRAQIIDQLNRLTYQYLKRSFNDLCMLSLNAADYQSARSSRNSTPLVQQAKVFISYSRKDSRYLQELHSHLDYYAYNDIVSYWDDTKIRPGSLWMDELQQALDAAEMAILLVSPDFLASDFILREELPQIVNAARQSTIALFSVILRPCLFSDSDLAPFQTVNPPSQPLSNMSRGKRDEIWVKVAKLVEHSIKG